MLIVSHFTVWKDDSLMGNAPRSYIFYLIATKLTASSEQQDKWEASLLCHQVCNTFIVDIAWFINSFHYNL